MKTGYMKKIGSIILFAALTILSVSVTVQFNGKLLSLSADILKELEDVAYAAEVSSGAHSEVYVYAFYDPKETIILFNDQDDPASPFYVPNTEEPYDGAGYRANYPEIAFVTLVALKRDEEGGYSIYEGGDGEIRVKMRLKTFQADEKIHPIIKHYINNLFPYQLIDLDGEESPLWNIDNALPEDELSRGTIDWKGFFLALDNGNGKGIRSLKEALAKTNEYRGYKCIFEEDDSDDKLFAKWEMDAPRNDIEISMGESGTPVRTIAVKSWHFSEFKGLPFELENIVEFAGELEAKIITVKTGDTKDIVKNGEIVIDVNVNNVDLVRRNIQGYIDGARGRTILDLIPEKAETYTTYTDDPGPFVVKGMVNKRPYSKIIEILVDEANGREKHPSSFTYEDTDPERGDTDWIEVAAADIYDHPDDNTKKVFRCVWEIGATYDFKHNGSVSAPKPYRIYLKPLGYKMRFNGGTSKGYNFFTAGSERNGVIFHESLHCYHLLHGEEVYDSEDPSGWILKSWGRTPYYLRGDQLYVGENDKKNPYLTFSYDHKERGFLSPRVREGKADPVGDYLYGQYGSKHSYPRHTYVSVPDRINPRWKNPKYLKKDEYGHFITRIDDKLVNTTKPDKPPYLDPNDPKFKAKYNAMKRRALIEIFYGPIPDGDPVRIESDIPDDLPPRKKNSNRITGVYLYKPPLKPDGVGKWRLLPNDKNPWIALSLTKERKVKRDYGSYTACRYSIARTTNSYPLIPPEGLPEAEDCFKMIEQGYQLYVRYSILYHHNPYEYDASYFEITHGEQDE